MIDLRNESTLTLAQAARMLPPGRRGRPATLSCVLRWVRDGVKTPTGTIRLEAIRLGGRWLTSVEALERFAARQTPAFGERPAPPTPRTPAQRERATRAATRELEAEGI
jgi:hypothetical protein